MQSNHSRAVNGVSISEVRRRWGAVRQKMLEAGRDPLIVQNSSDWVGGYIRWFSNQPATNGYPSSLVFPLQNGMSLIEQGPFGGVRVSGPEETKRSGVARRLTTPSYPSVGYTMSYDAEIVLSE